MVRKKQIVSRVSSVKLRYGKRRVFLLCFQRLSSFPGNYEIGVHIADVSFFIDEHSALDKVASDRATSVYLVQKVGSFSCNLRYFGFRSANKFSPSSCGHHLEKTFLPAEHWTLLCLGTGCAHVAQIIVRTAVQFESRWRQAGLQCHLEDEWERRSKNELILKL